MTGALVIALALLAGFGLQILSADLIVASDLRQQFVIWLNYLNWSLRECGLPPYWDPFSFSGRPFIAALQPACFYPPVFLCALLFTATRAANLLIFFHLLWAGFGMYRLARHYTRSGSAGLVAGLAYAGSGYLVTCVAWGHLTMVMTAAWLPCIILYCELYHESRNRRWLGFLAIAMTLQLLAGHPQISYYTVMLLLARHLWLTWRRPEAIGARARIFAWPLLALVLAAGLAAPQLLSTRELLRQCTRVHAVEDYRMFAYWSLEPRSFARALLPFVYGSARGGDSWRTVWAGLIGYEEYYLYLGIVPLFLIAGLIFSRGRPSPSGFYLVVLLAALLLALGKYTPLCRLAYDWLPGFHLFRWPVRILVLYAFAGSLLAGLGWAQFWSRPVGRVLTVSVVAAWLLVAGGVALWITGRGTWESLAIGFGQRLYAAQAGAEAKHEFAHYAGKIPLLTATITTAAQRLALLLGGIVAVVLLRRCRSGARRFAQGALLAVLLADSIGFMRGFAVYSEAPLYPDLQQLAGQIPENGRCWIDPGLAWRNAGTLYRVRNVDGYDPFVLRSYAELTGPAAGRDADENNPLGTLDYNADPFRQLGLDYLVMRPGLVPDPGKWETLDTTAAAGLFRRRERGEHRVFAGGTPLQVLREEWHPTRYAYEVVVPAGEDRVLTLSQPDYPGWGLSVDGKPVMRAGSGSSGGWLMQTSPLAPGSHVITGEYRPVVFQIGLGIALLSGLGLLLLARPGRIG